MSGGLELLDGIGKRRPRLLHLHIRVRFKARETVSYRTTFSSTPAFLPLRMSLSETCKFPRLHPWHTKNLFPIPGGAGRSQAMRQRIYGASPGEPRTPRSTSRAQRANLHVHVSLLSTRHSIALPSANHACRLTTSQSPLSRPGDGAVYSLNSSKRTERRAHNVDRRILDQIPTSAWTPTSRSRVKVREPKKRESTSWRCWRQVRAKGS